MMITYIFRKPNPSFFSIERIFLRMAMEVGKTGRPLEKIMVPDPGITLKNIFFTRALGRRRERRIFHVTGDVHYAALALPRRRTVLTIHDCVFMYQVKGLKRFVLKKLFLDWPVRYCRTVTTISEATKTDIIRFTGCRPEKIVVIPNPVDDQIRYKPKPFSEAEPVLLFIGSTPNKNLERVISALEGVPCRLEIVGRLTDTAIGSLQQHGIRYSQRTGLSDDEMRAMYESCDIVLFPSLFEGFGLPILEGQQAGRPVITSNLSPMKEVAGGAACLVDPFDVASIREGVLRVIGDKDYREQLVRRGLANAAEYSVEKTAQRYLDVYLQLEKS